MKTSHLIGCLLLGVSLTITACDKAGKKADAGSTPLARDAAAEDKAAVEELARANKAEARQWLKAANHVVFKNDKETISKYVEDFYTAGATTNYFTGIETLNGTDLSATLVVVLPQDPAARAKVFEVGNRVSTAMGEQPEKDQGQKYFLFELD